MAKFTTVLTITDEEMDDRIMKALCLPFFFYGSDIEVDIEYNFIPAFPGNWDNPSEPEEIEVIDVKVTSALIEVSVMDIEGWVNYTFDFKPTEKQKKLLSEMLFEHEDIEVKCFEDYENSIQPDWEEML